MGNTLGSGSGIPGADDAVGDFTIAGVATRVVTVPPADSDWGATPPPVGTFVLEGDAGGAILYARMAVGVWVPIAWGPP